MTRNRTCPRSHPSTPHDLWQDADGSWYCPLERAAERERKWIEQEQEKDPMPYLTPNTPVTTDQRRGTIVTVSPTHYGVQFGHQGNVEYFPHHQVKPE